MIASLTRSRATRLWRPLLFGAGAVLAGAVALPLPALGAVAAPNIAYHQAHAAQRLDHLLL